MSQNMFSEDGRVKIPALVHLTRLGYTYRSTKKIHDTTGNQKFVKNKCYNVTK